MIPTSHLTSTLMDSMTSIKTSFFLYLIPSDLQDTALVTVVGTLDFATSSFAPSWVIYLQEMRWEAMPCCDSTLHSHIEAISLSACASESLTLVGSCCLLSVGIQSPSVHPVAHRRPQNYPVYSPPPALWSTLWTPVQYEQQTSGSIIWGGWTNTYNNYNSSLYVSLTSTSL